MRTIEYYRHEADRQSFAARSARDAGRHDDAAHYWRLARLAQSMADHLAAEAEAAIDEIVDRSVSHDLIIHIDGDDAAHAALCIRCDGSADTDDVTEYWGVRDDGAEWRVHVRGGQT